MTDSKIISPDRDLRGHNGWFFVSCFGDTWNSFLVNLVDFNPLHTFWRSNSFARNFAWNMFFWPFFISKHISLCLFLINLPIHFQVFPLDIKIILGQSHTFVPNGCKVKGHLGFIWVINILVKSFEKKSGLYIYILSCVSLWEMNTITLGLSHTYDPTAICGVS